MRIIRGRADARWLPSRYNFALFRLGAYLKMRRAKPEPRHVILFIDRHQSAFENYSVSIWILITVTCFLAAFLPVFAAVPIALVLVELPLLALAVLLSGWKGDHLRLQSMVSMFLLIAAAGWLAMNASWVRFVAWQFLGLVALNAVAAVIVFLLRGSIARLENAVGGATSEL